MGRRSPRRTSGTSAPWRVKGGDIGVRERKLKPENLTPELGQNAVLTLGNGCTRGEGSVVENNEKDSGFLKAHSPSGLCGGRGQSHHPTPQLLLGWGAHPLISEPSPCAGYGLTGPLHCFCESSNEVPGTY